MQLDIANNVYLVTGGTSGLGLACARELVNQGAKVVIAGRDQERCSAAAANLGRENAICFAADIADPDVANRLVAIALARFGRLDGGVISVGGPPATTALATTDDQWNESFASIFLGALRMVRTIAANANPALDKTAEVALVAILSTSVTQAIPGLSISNALRPALAAALGDLARELGPRRVRINGLLPGRFATDRVFTLDARVGSPEVVRKRNEEMIPLGRYGEPEEFAAVAAFLLSPHSSYLTGAMIPIDGGLTA